MKKIIPCVLGLLTLNLHAQTSGKQIDINSVVATIHNVGPLFWNGNEGIFSVPKETGKRTIFAASAWIGGLSNNQLYLNAETYRQNGKDLQQGPVLSTYTMDTKHYWNRVWSVKKSDIATFRINIQNNEDVSGMEYKDILEWPAKGNVKAGDTTRGYAPFVDVNSNGKYDPLTGDYPLIKGDMCLYSVMNDDITSHTESGGAPMKVEIHRTTYAYKEEMLSKVLFVDYKVINRSGRTYDSLLFSSWIDFDLGTYNDDYVATDTSRNMIYAYNGMPSDNGLEGYGATPPAQACVVLSHKLWASMYYNNSFSPQTGNPSVPAHFFNLMKGNWIDSTLKTASDSGYKTNGPVTRFSFSGDPCDSIGWNEGSAGNMPGDRRILGTIEPITLAPEAELNVSVAFVYARAESGDNIASVCALKSETDKVQQWYDESKTGLFDQVKNEVQFQISPNPVNDVLLISLNEKKMTASIFDITGKKIRSVEDETRISVSDLNNGLYFIRVQAQDGSTGTKKFIKQ